MKGDFCSYLRVSTQRQGENGYGLGAQRQTVLDYLNGGSWTLEKEFIEQESAKGGLDRRPVLKEALAYCKRKGCTLLVAKLDRLARNVAFVSALIESKVPFKCCDFPEANKITLQLLSVFGEYERDMISERTKAGLAQAKAQGVKLGNPRLYQLNIPRRKAGLAFAETMRPHIQAMQSKGFSQRRMVDWLNEQGITTSADATWTQFKLQKLLKRIDAPKPTYKRISPMLDNRLRQLRLEKGLTVRQLEKLSGVPRATISQAELKHPLKAKRAEQLAKALGCEPGELIF